MHRFDARWSCHPLAGAAAVWFAACGGTTTSLISSSDAAVKEASVAGDAPMLSPEGGTSDGAVTNDADATDSDGASDASSRVVFCPSGPAFMQTTPINLGNAPYFVRVGDFNGDRHLDVAVPNQGDGTLSVLFGDGTGALVNASGSPYAVGSAPCSEAIGDFNGDGLADIAVMNSGPGSISLLLGSAAGGLTAAPGSPFALGAQSNQSCGPAAGDINGDGKLDLVAPVGGALRILFGDGHGSLAQTSSGYVSGTLQVATLADFNRDGLLDVAATNYTGNTVSVYLGDGHGGLTSGSGSPWPIGSSAAGLVTGDFNRDGFVDVAVVGYGAGNVSVLLGDGKGGFANAPGSPVAVGSTPTDVATADFDGDGNLDLVVTVNGSSTIAILRGNGTGAFASATGSPVSVGPYPGSLAAGDFNEDGKIDVAFTNNIPGTWTVSLLLNTCTP
jgi:hypothetical protein